MNSAFFWMKGAHYKVKGAIGQVTECPNTGVLRRSGKVKRHMKMQILQCGREKMKK